MTGPTPAGAGSTCSAAKGLSRTAAYPRWRGEHKARFDGCGMVGGLPPLARGALVCGLALAAFPWPTPAGAGSTRRLDAA